MGGVALREAAVLAFERQEPAFQIGTLVVLKSGGPPMTVVRNHKDGMDVLWFNGSTVMSVQLPESAVEPVYRRQRKTRRLTIMER